MLNGHRNSCQKRYKRVFITYKSIQWWNRPSQEGEKSKSTPTRRRHSLIYITDALTCRKSRAGIMNQNQKTGDTSTLISTPAFRRILSMFVSRRSCISICFLNPVSVCNTGHPRETFTPRAARLPYSWLCYVEGKNKKKRTNLVVSGILN